MKVTCIIGSARNNGSSAYLTQRFIDGLNGRAEVKKYCVGDMNIGFCKGCKSCYVTGVCVQNDDVKGAVEDIMSSDYVFMVAPSYWAGVPGQLKTFFDRTTPYGDTNPKRIVCPKEGAKGIAVAVRAGTREAENALILDSIEHYFGHLGIQTVKRISILQTDTLDDLLQKHGEEIEQIFLLGQSVVNV